MSPDGIMLKAEHFQVINNKVYVNLNKVKKNPGMLLIWGDFCSHCHRFMPTFNKIVKKLGKNFECTSIESNELKGENKLMSALNFGGYPTLYFFDKNGLIISQYEGQRKEESILDEICKVYHHCVKYH